MDLKGLAEILEKSGLIVKNNNEFGINFIRVFELSRIWADQIGDSIEGPRASSSARSKNGQPGKSSSAKSRSSDKDDAKPSTSAAALAAISGINVPPAFPIIGAIKDKEVNINTEGLEAGNAYIINTLRFNDLLLKERRGSLVDVTRLISVLDKFHMNIESILDATLSDVKSLMKKIASHDFRKVSCLMIVIMSHGYEGNIVAAKDGHYSIDRDIMYPILQNQTLVSKLKLVVAQACKGSVDPMRFQVEGPDAKPPSVFPSEILQLNSCVEGYASFLNPRLGSVFINTLCDNLEKHGFTTDILSIANKVVADVKRKYSDIQIPMIHSNLTKPYVFGHYIGKYDDHSSSDSD